ncbi:GNAT family N-acetyltransferase [Pseudovibrio sp. Tun.PSC04-5.I4]|uniref:GNAT family N-acetyltransferase n=1 Tax=Pseudovibrio sp. Tun.PSC04-5.I4 TaxID=1798213 RepID=UPI00088A4AA4|nr:GNAT family N-acetyltransferase [Pseudovibrio sp. Tun.PSC04-5.I4]SDR33940.1 Acetyltransferase (GNAT) domain-containing protein [Pseudovibrio sp. Tun.PSC04-5.I4]
MTTIPLSLDGYTELPSDKIATVVTYLEMHRKPQDRKVIERPDLSLHKVEQVDLAVYRHLFRAIGEPWLWFGRLVMSDAELTQVLQEETRDIYFAMKEGVAVGLLELDFSFGDNVELAYFGLVPDHIGGGSGRWLMNHAIDLAFAKPGIKRFFVHTCNGDSPQALPFYITSGFAPYKRAIEVADDPRLMGVLDKASAAHIPVLL